MRFKLEPTHLNQINAMFDWKKYNVEKRKNSNQMAKIYNNISYFIT